MASMMQAAREVLGRVLPKSWYLRVARRYEAWISAKLLGAAEYRRLKATQNAAPGGPAVLFSPPGSSYRVGVRPGTTDALVFISILARKSYEVYDPHPEPRFIIDGGANAGYSVVYFGLRHPQARIVALEPQSDNHRIATQNIAALGERARVLKLGLWPRKAHLRVVANERADGHQVIEVPESEPHDCVGIDPLTLLRESGEKRIDLLKCDIEGAELNLFADNPDPWLEFTDCAIVEIHNAEAEQAVYTAIRRHGFHAQRHREYHVFTRRSPSA
ncbi:MAG: FkbM family methyltransferase [Phycisphaerae bacterium]|nr:FkbM family methyltransferase [Phycisphaerae bacterium]